MTYRRIAILSLAILTVLTVGAQKRKKKVSPKKPVVVVVEEPQEDLRITNMREMTQQVIIIDSIVTDKDDFLSKFQLSSEAGNLITTRQFLRYDTEGYAFLNELGNKAYFSMYRGNNGRQLFTSDKLGRDWSDPIPLSGIGNVFQQADYPFMMNDGITFYFAAQGEESVGGYDIFFTRYDSHDRKFLKPENIGMPFNSEANDYMYAIDEANRIGYFVSDRRQPEGKVCVYIFIPSEVRKTYDPSVWTEQQIRDISEIRRIADTWGNGKERKEALARLKTLSTKSAEPSTRTQAAIETELVINDQLTYSKAEDFRSKEAAALYQQLMTARNQFDKTSTILGILRNKYQSAGSAEKQSLSREILQAEEELLQLDVRIRDLEQQARNTENKVINKI